MRVSVLAFIFTLVAATYPHAGTDPSMDWFHIRNTRSGGDVQSPGGTGGLPADADAKAERFQSLGGTVDLPADVKPEHCHLTLKVGSREVARWFPDTSSRTIRFEFTVYDTDFPHQVALVLSDCPPPPPQEDVWDSDPFCRGEEVVGTRPPFCLLTPPPGWA